VRDGRDRASASERTIDGRPGGAATSESVEPTPPEVAPTSTATTSAPAPTAARVTGKPLVPHHKASGQDPETGSATRAKTGINFGY